MEINAWEGAWPLGTYAARDASQLSGPAMDRRKQGLAMKPDDYRRLLHRRQEIRDRFAFVSTRFDGYVALSASGAAPVGLGFTGDTGMIVAASLLGTPAITLPLLSDENLPLGLQLIGMPDRDAELLAIAEWVWQNYDPA